MKFRPLSIPSSITILWILIVLSELFYLALLNLNAINGLQPVLTFWAEMGLLFVLYSIGYWVTLKGDGNKKQILYLIIAGGLLFRLTLLPAGLPHDTPFSEKIELISADLRGKEVVFERFLLFDSDIWRYLWDGHVMAAGVNPFQYAPLDVDLDELVLSKDGQLIIWDDIRENINYAHVPTVYPPFAQWVFWIGHWLAPGSIIMMKLVLILFELIGIFFLTGSLKKLNLPPSSIILYAWNPLMIKVFAGSGHMDAILVACLGAMVYFLLHKRPLLITISVACAVLAKLSPLILFPFLIRRLKWPYLLFLSFLIGLGYLFYIDAGARLFEGFLTFSREWQFNAGIFGLIQWLVSFFTENPSEVARAICSILLIATILVLAIKDDLTNNYFIKAGTITFGALLMLSPTIMPRYLSWVLPFALLSRQYSWFVFSAFLLIAFHIMINQIEYALALWLEFGLFFVLLLVHRQIGTFQSRQLLTISKEESLEK